MWSLVKKDNFYKELPTLDKALTCTQYICKKTFNGLMKDIYK